MRRREHRHPALETAVFAAALLLAGFIARELWRRRPAEAPPPPPRASSAVPVPLMPERPSTPGGKIVQGPPERGVTRMSRLKATRRARRAPAEVPAPK